MTASAKKAAPAKRAESVSKKDVVAAVSRRDIEAQVKAFLSSGGKIQKIPNGVSGQQSLLPTRKHIVITKKKA